MSSFRRGEERSYDAPYIKENLVIPVTIYRRYNLSFASASRGGWRHGVKFITHRDTVPSILHVSDPLPSSRVPLFLSDHGKVGLLHVRSSRQVFPAKARRRERSHLRYISRAVLPFFRVTDVTTYDVNNRYSHCNRYRTSDGESGRESARSRRRRRRVEGSLFPI